MRSPILSIIVPIYNVGNYLIVCLESILDQSFYDFELLLIDDGSIDNSGKICDEYANKDKRVVVIHKQNAGVSSARNVGLDIALGSYITFVDPDDEIEQYTYSSNLDYLIRNQDIDILQFPTCWNYQTINERKDQIKSQIFIGEEEILANWWKGDVINASVWNKIFRKELFNKIRFLENHVFEDLYLLVDFARIAKKVYISEKGCYYYKIRENSISNSLYSISRNLDLFTGQLKVYRELSFFEHLRLYRLVAFSRLYRRLLTTKLSCPQFDLNYYLNDLQYDVPTWNDIFLSKDTNEKIWTFFIKILGLPLFSLLFCKYIKLKDIIANKKLKD